MVTFVQVSFVLATFVHIGNISGVTYLILTILFKWGNKLCAELWNTLYKMHKSFLLLKRFYEPHSHFSLNIESNPAHWIKAGHFSVRNIVLLYGPAQLSYSHGNTDIHGNIISWNCQWLVRLWPEAMLVEKMRTATTAGLLSQVRYMSAVSDKMNCFCDNPSRSCWSRLRN